MILPATALDCMAFMSVKQVITTAIGVHTYAVYLSHPGGADVKRVSPEGVW